MDQRKKKMRRLEMKAAGKFLKHGWFLALAGAVWYFFDVKEEAARRRGMEEKAKDYIREHADEMKQ